MDDHPSLSRDIQTVEIALGTDALLKEQLALLEKVSQAADDAARRDLFSRHLFGKSHNTARMYRAAFTALRAFLARFDERLDVSLAEEPRLWQVVSFGLVEAFQRWLLAEGYAIKSANDYLSVVKTYAGLAQQAGLMEAETLLAIQRIPRLSGQRATNIEKERAAKKQPTRRGHKKAAAVYFEEEHRALLERLFTTPDLTTPQGCRDLVALRLLYDLGVRPGEAIALRFSHLDLSRRRLQVNRYKTGLQQYLELPDTLFEAVVGYLVVRRDWPPYRDNPGKETDAPLLVQSRKTKELFEECDLAALREAEQQEIETTGSRKRKAPLPASADWSTQQLWEQVRKLSLAAGLAPLSPYDGRHQWTYDEVTSGTPHPIIMKAGGWKAGSRMVERYYGLHEVANTGTRATRGKKEGPGALSHGQRAGGEQRQDEE
jgi:integrase